MISFDANLLLYASNTASPFYAKAKEFFEALSPRETVIVSELVLTEFYTLLRNPAVLTHPLNPAAAAAVIQAYRRHPRWLLVGFATDSVALHQELWQLASQANFARRRIYDTRLALTLRHHGVTEFATANVKDFQAFGFKKVWNPLMGNL
ncbi:MAG: TA system VapC family ribonuclease toxin [Verrucomicrobiota bacterium]